MTVAPGWPQDGNGPSKPYSGASTDDGSNEVLPPTLFQLPSLRSEPAQEPKRVATAPSSPPSIHPFADVPAIGEEPQESEPVHEPARTIQLESLLKPLQVPAPPPQTFTQEVGSEPVRNADPKPTDESSEETLSAPELRTSPEDDPIRKPIPPARLPSGTPAGRSWSESIGSHGIVFALLLVVVAAALITGRDGEEDAVESRIAEHSDLLEFDSGQFVSFPESTTADPDVSTDSEALASGAPFLDPLYDVEQTSSESMEAPNTPSMASGFDATMASTTTTTSDGVPAMTASSRSEAYSAPSLEDLTAPRLQTPAPQRQSSTPAKMQNLLKYLPPLPANGPTE